MARIARLLTILAASVLLAACASSHVLTGTPRPPIHPDHVRIYYGPPPGGYEEIARLDVGSGAFTYGNRNKANAVMRNLRREAAKLGANVRVGPYAVIGPEVEVGDDCIIGSHVVIHGPTRIGR